MTINQLDLLHGTKAPMTDNLRQACQALQEGRIILLLDAHDRENEGDLIVAAEKITTESMNFLIKHGSGIVCMPLPKSRLFELNLPMMSAENTNSFETAFTVSIEARFGVTTGVSAKDRAHTIRVAMADDAVAKDLARPGHVFPLAAKEGGVFSRMGHTEGSVDLMKIANLKAGAVLCELMNDDGSMAVGEDRIRFANRFNMPVVSVEEVLFYRLMHETCFEHEAKSVSTRFGKLLWHRFDFLGQVHIDVLMNQSDTPPLAPMRLSIVDDTCLTDRFIKMAITNNDDDAFIASLHQMSEQKLDAVVLTTAKTTPKNTVDTHSFMQGALLRSLVACGVKKISSAHIKSALATIATTYFSIAIY